MLKITNSEPVMTIPLAEVLCCGPMLVVESYPLLLTITNDFIWNRDGERRIVPKEVLLAARECKAAYKVLEKYRRIPCVPKDMGVIFWEQGRPYMVLTNSEVTFQPSPKI
jgi:hypothetical protein